MKLNKPYQILLVVASLIIFALVSRVLPHMANFAPIAAIAIFGSAVLPKKWALVLPLAAMIISDLVIGLHPLILFTWGSFVLIALISTRTLKNINPTNVVLTSFSASVIFYLITNFGVWLQGLMYPMTTSGLIQCYYNALPFFRNTMLGDLIYTTVLFSVYALVTKTAATKTVTSNRATI